MRPFGGTDSDTETQCSRGFWCLPCVPSCPITVVQVLTAVWLSTAIGLYLILEPVLFCFCARKFSGTGESVSPIPLNQMNGSWCKNTQSLVLRWDNSKGMCSTLILRISQQKDRSYSCYAFPIPSHFSLSYQCVWDRPQTNGVQLNLCLKICSLRNLNTDNQIQHVYTPPHPIQPSPGSM